MLINRLKILSGKYRNNLDLDLHNKHKILIKDLNLLKQDNVNKTNEIKIYKCELETLKNEIHSLKKYIEKNDKPLFDIQELEKNYFN